MIGRWYFNNKPLFDPYSFSNFFKEKNSCFKSLKNSIPSSVYLFPLLGEHLSFRLLLIFLYFIFYLIFLGKITLFSILHEGFKRMSVPKRLRKVFISPQLLLSVFRAYGGYALFIRVG